MWSVHKFGVKNGETKRVDCPVCKGTKTFTITNNMGKLMWNCYRATCNVGGGKRVRLSVDDIRTSLLPQEKSLDVAWEMPTNLIYHPPYTQRFVDKYRLPSDLELMYDVKEDRVVFTIWKSWKCVDAIGRAIDSGRLPKWKRYGNSDLPFTYGYGSVAVVVEDCISAVVVGEIDVYVGVAVLGTSLSEAHKKYLSQFSTAIVALDPDALPKTMQFAKELRQHVAKVRVLKLTDDLKYRNYEDIENLPNIGV